jgi:hypothetical protein
MATASKTGTAGGHRLLSDGRISTSSAVFRLVLSIAQLIAIPEQCS